MKAIPNYPDYYINTAGEIFSKKKRYQKPVKLRPIKTFKAHGYTACFLIDASGVYRKCYTHRLLLSTYNRQPKDGEQCRHLNGDRSDNKLENLAWGTPSENQLDRNLHGTSNAGERHGMNKYSDELVTRIREEAKTIQQKELAKKYGLPKSTISWLVTQGRKNL